MVSGEPPLTQHRQDQGAGGGFRETEQRTPITIDKTPVERVNSFKFLGVHITEDLTWSAHTDAVLKKSHQLTSESVDVSSLFFLTEQPLLPDTAEEVWNEPQHPQIILNMHCGEHPDRLHHRQGWLFPSGYQANEQSELIHPTAHSHFTICHALHFNSTVQTGLHVHTAQIQQSICYHWIPSNAHP